MSSVNVFGKETADTFSFGLYLLHFREVNSTIYKLLESGDQTNDFNGTSLFP